VSEAIPPERLTPTGMCNEEIASGYALAMTERGVIESHFFLFVIASERSERSNPLKTLNTKRNVQWGDCFTPAHLPTLRFAMTGCCERLLRRFAPRNDEKEGKAFCNKNNNRGCHFFAIFRSKTGEKSDLGKKFFILILYFSCKY